MAIGRTNAVSGGEEAVAGYFVNNGGTITFQPVVSGGTAESVSSIEIVDTGVAEPEYEGWSSKIYKCASVNTSAKTWTGYLYDQSTQSIASTTTNLTYSSAVAPTVGKYYTEDGLIECSVYKQSGLVFYAPMHSTTTTAETGQNIYIGNGFSFTEHNGLKMAYSTGESCTTFDVSNDFPTTGDRTISCWCDSISIYSGYECFAFGWGGEYVGGCCGVGVLREDNGRYYFGSLYSDDATSTVVGGLKHLLFTYNHSTSNQTLYINGVSIVTKTFTDSVDTATYNGKIGAAPWSSAGWTGYIAECKIWDRVLSQSEITAEYNRLQALITD